MRITPEDVLRGPIKPTLYRMTMPLVLGIFVMMAFGAADTFFISMMGAEPLTAICFTFPVTMVIFNLIVGLSIGVSVLVSSSIGGKSKARSIQISSESLLLCLLLVVLASSVGYLAIEPLFQALGASATTMPYIIEYMSIWFVAIGFMVMPIIGSSIIRATGDTKWPSIMMISSGLINAILDPIFIFGLGPIPAMGMRGAAYATTVSWVAGFGLAFWLLCWRDQLISLKPRPLPDVLKFWGALLKIGLPISIANMMMPFAMAALTRLVANYGEFAVAGLGVGVRIESFGMVVPLATTAALSPFIAQNLGANNIERAHTSLISCVKFILLFQLGVWVVLSTSGYWLTQMFSDDPAILQAARTYLWIMPAAMGLYSMLIVLNTAFNAAHRSELTLLTSSIRIIALYIPMAWLGGKLFGFPGLFLGACIGNACGTYFGWIVYQRLRRKSFAKGQQATSEETLCATLC